MKGTEKDIKTAQSIINAARKALEKQVNESEEGKEKEQGKLGLKALERLTEGATARQIIDHKRSVWVVYTACHMRNFRDRVAEAWADIHDND